MTETKGEQFSKRVEFKETDGDEQIATGVVMVPDKVDLQGDYVREETIRAFAEQFENFEDVDEADGGVMHAAWPTDHISLEDNEVLDEATDIGGSTAPAGAWIQSWKFDDDELWGLVDDGILSGYSIGGVDITWSSPMDQDELPDDVDVAEAYPDDEWTWELQDGIIREVSAVDIPAVPDAQILQTKSEAIKRLGDHLGNRDGFIEEAMERGHSETEATRLWAYLHRAIDIDGAGEPGDKSNGRLAAVGKAVLEALTGGSVGDAVETNSTKTDPAAGDGGDDGSKSAADSMTDEDDNEPPEWAKTLMEQTEENAERIEQALEADDDGDGDAGKNADGDGDGDPFENAPEWAKELKERQEQNAQRIDDVAKASGTSQQVGGASATEPSNRKYSKSWDDTLGLPSGGDA